MKKNFDKIVFVIYFMIMAIMTCLLAPSCAMENDDMIQACIQVKYAKDVTIGQDIHDEDIRIMWPANTSITVRWNGRNNKDVPVEVRAWTRREREKGDWHLIHTVYVDEDKGGVILPIFLHEE